MARWQWERVLGQQVPGPFMPSTDLTGVSHGGKLRHSGGVQWATRRDLQDESLLLQSTRAALDTLSGIPGVAGPSSKSKPGIKAAGPSLLSPAVGSGLPPGLHVCVRAHVPTRMPCPCASTLRPAGRRQMPSSSSSPSPTARPSMTCPPRSHVSWAMLEASSGSLWAPSILWGVALRHPHPVSLP